MELYAGNKWFVYVDARVRQFLDDAEMSLVECKSPSVPMVRDAREGADEHEKNGFKLHNNGTVSDVTSMQYIMNIN